VGWPHGTKTHSSNGRQQKNKRGKNKTKINKKCRLAINHCRWFSERIFVKEKRIETQKIKQGDDDIIIKRTQKNKTKKGHVYNIDQNFCLVPDRKLFENDPIKRLYNWNDGGRTL
jgi:hypothetical protein